MGHPVYVSQNSSFQQHLTAFTSKVQKDHASLYIHLWDKEDFPFLSQNARSAYTLLLLL